MLTFRLDDIESAAPLRAMLRGDGAPPPAVRQAPAGAAPDRVSPAGVVEFTLDDIDPPDSNLVSFSLDDIDPPDADLDDVRPDDVSSREPDFRTGVVAELPRDTSMGERLTDVGISALKGAIGVPEAAVGVADLLTGGRAGRALEDYFGFKPQEAKAILDTYYSEGQQAAFQRVQDAEGVVDKAVAALSNPSVIAHSVVESAPLMLGGAGVSRGVLAVAPRVGALAAGAIGEGAVSAGSTAEQVRQASPDRQLTPTQSGLAAVSGVLTGALGVFSGKLARTLGLADVETLLAGAAADRTARKGLTRQIIEGAVQEGFLEELPQSVQEQVLQNRATGRDLLDGVDDAAVLGALTGAAMGAGAQVVDRAMGPSETEAPPPPPPPPPAAEATPTTTTPPPAASSAPPPPAPPTPARITQRTAAALRALGYNTGQISGMTPEDAARILAAGEAAPSPSATPPRDETVAAPPDRAEPAAPGVADGSVPVTFTADEIEAVEPPAVSSEAEASEPEEEAIRRAMAPAEFEHYALRLHREPVDVGEVLPESWRWDNGERTEDLLDGTSAIEVTPETVEQVAARLRKEYPLEEGDTLVLVGGNRAGRGEDAGERVIRDARVLWTERGRATAATDDVAEDAGPHEYASTQVNLPDAVSTQIRALGERIPDEDLAAGGRETGPHVTVQYGIDNEDVDALSAALAGEAPITVRLGKTSLFENDDADVVKVDITSDDLRRVRDTIAQTLEAPGDTHPDYLPHATIAYVKPGRGQAYAGDTSLEGQTATIDRLTFSLKDGQQVEIPLTGTSRASAPPRRTGMPFARSQSDTRSRSVDASPVVQKQQLTRDQAFLLRWLADDLAEIPYEQGGQTAQARRDAYDRTPGARFDPELQGGLISDPHVAGTPTKAMFEALGVTASRPEIARQIDRYLMGDNPRPTKAVQAARRLAPVLEAAWDGQRFDFSRVPDETLSAAGVSRTDLRSPITLPQDIQPPDLLERFAPPSDAQRRAEIDDRRARAQAFQARARDRIAAQEERTAAGDEGDLSFDPDAIEQTEDEDDETIKARTLARVEADLDGYVDRYLEAFDHVIAADNASELFPEYSQSEETRATRVGAVRPAASRVVERAFARKLAEPVAEGELPVAVFTSGGNGSGKSTSVDVDGPEHVVFDSTLSQLEPSAAKIDQALDAGLTVRINHVSRDPVEAWQAALDRAMSDESAGRTVTLAGLASTHEGARKTLLALADRYAQNPRVQIRVWENTDQGPVARSLDWLRKQTYPTGDALRSTLRQVLDDAHTSGAVSDAVYAGAKGLSAADRGTEPPARRAHAAGLPRADSGHAAEAAVDAESSSLSFTADNLAATFDLTAEQAEATVALAEAMGLDLSRLRVTKGGVPGKGALLQAPVVVLRGDELGQVPTTGSAIALARAWFKAHLQGRYIKRMELVRPIRFTGKSLDELRRGMRSDPRKAQLLPAIDPVLKRGRYVGREELRKPRRDDIVAFHRFEAPVQLGDERLIVTALVGEDVRGNLVYDIRLPQTPAAPGGPRVSRGAGAEAEGGTTLSDRLADLAEDDNLLYQSDRLLSKASVEFVEGGTALIRALEHPDVSSGIHELAHVARRFLFDRAVPAEQRAGISDEDIATAEQWAGTKAVNGRPNQWTRAAEEKFARGFERYLRGKAAPPDATLRGLFAKIRGWLSDIYTTIAGSPVDVHVSPAMRQVYDRLVTRGTMPKAAARSTRAKAKPKKQAPGGHGSDAPASTSQPVKTGTVPVAEGRLLFPPEAAPLATTGATGVVTRTHAIEVPELVAFASDLIGTPGVVKRFRKDTKIGEFSERRGIRLAADLFAPGNEQQLAKTLAHEIGHLVDWLPDQSLKRGNLLGRLRSLDRFLKHTFTSADGQIIHKTDVRNELLAWSKAWRGDWAGESASYQQYRQRGTELYADALSGLLNNPGLLEEEAPTFYRQFFENLDTKPDVKAAYFALQELLSGTRAELVERRLARDREMFAFGDTKAADLERLRQAELAATRRSFWLRLRIALVDKNTALIDRAKALQKRGVRLSPDSDPRYFLEERNYLGAQQKAWLEQHIEPLYQALQREGLTWTDFGQMLFYDRIIDGDRSDVANPNGLAKKDAMELREALREGMTDRQRDALDRALTDFRAAMAAVHQAGYDAGLYTDETWVQMQENPGYATFRALEYLDSHVSAGVHRQVGTLKWIQNPGDATVLKLLATIRAVETQKMKRAAFGMLETYFPSDIEQAPQHWNGQAIVPVEPKDPSKQKAIYYYEQGRRRAKYVDPFVAASLQNESIGHNNALTSVVGWLNGRWFRPIFTTMNLGFQGANAFRDFGRFWKNMPDMTLQRALQRYGQAVPMAKARAFGVKPGARAKMRRALQTVQEGEAAKVFSIPFSDVIAMADRDVNDTAIEELFLKSGVRGYGVPPPKASAIRQAARAFIEWIKNTGDFIETLPKAAALIEFTGNGDVSRLTAEERSFIRRKVGSPDFLQGATWTPVTNNVFLFSNAIIQAWRADLEVATDPKTRAGFWWKTAAANVLPKLAIVALLAASLDDDDPEWLRTLQRFYRGMSSYDRTNYLPIPIGFDELGNVAYLRLPQDDSGRLIGGLTSKVAQLALRDGDQDTVTTLSLIFDYIGGQGPGLAPIFGVAGDTMDMLAGRNVYDSFRSRFLFTDDELAARDWRTVKKFIGYEFQQVGGGIVWKFFPGEQRPREQSEAQRLLELPVVSSLAGRFLRITNFGEVERLRTTRKAVQRTEARQRLDVNAAVNDALREYAALAPPYRTPARQTRLARDVVARLYPDASPRERQEALRKVRAKIQMGALRGSADPLADAVMGSTSNQQKVTVIQRAAAEMTADELERWLRQARRTGVISASVDREVRRAKETP